MTKVSHPIQAWYATATRDDNGVLRIDDAQAFDDCIAGNLQFNNVTANMDTGSISSSLNPSTLMNCSVASRDNRVLDGLEGEISTVTVVVDNAKIVGLPIGAVADYIAMLALSQTQAFESCQPIHSITNLMTPNCEAQQAEALTDTDIAYLKALYKMDPDVFLPAQQSDIAHKMEAALGGK